MIGRGFLCVVLIALILGDMPFAQQPATARTIVSRADLIYKQLTSSNREGVPIGNGRVTALVWTTPGALKFQINRVGIQPINKDTGFVDLELVGAGTDVFTAEGMTQRLSVYEGLLDVKAVGVSARLLAWHERDVIAIEVDDRRAVPQPIQIDLRAGERTERSQIAARDGRIFLTQDFDEGTRHAKSAVAVALLGRRTLVRFANEMAGRITTPAERGRIVILIASSATLDPGHDVAGDAFANLDAAAAKSFDDLAGDNAEWWHDFWERGTLYLHSADGVADHFADYYHYYRYLMATGSAVAVPVTP